MVEKSWGLLMNKLKLSIGLLVLFLASCGGGSSSGGGSAGNTCSTGEPFMGCWITAGCQSMTSPIPGQSIWGTIRYHFKSDGKIYDLVAVYANSSCNGTPVFQDAAEGFTDLAFVDQGVEMFGSGVSGNRLVVQDISPSASGSPSVDVLTTVTADNRLCLSDNLQLSTEGYRFAFMDATAIDFNNCLDKFN